MPLTKASPDVVQGLFRRNLIINGDFDLWQRGITVSQAGNTTHQYLADRFFVEGTAGYQYTMSKSADVPDAPSQSSLKVVNINQLTNPAATDRFYIGYAVEGFDFKRFVDQTAVLSFKVKSSVAGQYYVSFRNSVNDAAYIVPYTIDTINTWETKKFTVVFDYTFGTWDYANGAGLKIAWPLASGTSRHGTAPNVWEATNGMTLSDAVNWGGVAGASFQLSQIQFELGATPSSFEYIPLAAAVVRAQRYYEKTYDLNVVPGTITYEGALYGVPHAIAAGNLYFNHQFKVLKRSTPTITTYNPLTGAIGSSSGASGGPVTASGTGTSSTAIYNSGNLPGTGASFIHSVVDAEL